MALQWSIYFHTQLALFEKDARFLQKLAYLVAYEEIESAVDKETLAHVFKKIKPAFKEAVLEYKHCLNQSHRLITKDFIATDSRRPVLRTLFNSLCLSQLRQQNKTIAHKGVNWILLNGPAGIGKSALIIEYLKSQGYHEYHADASKRYTVITPTNLQEVEEIVKRVFHQGGVLVIDEINTMMLNLLLNHYSLGVDADGKPLQKQSGLIFATQNPATFVGRQVLSPDLLNRFRQVNLEAYTKEELLLIANHKKLQAAPLLVDLFYDAYCFATDKKITPAPTIRQLLNPYLMKEAILKEQVNLVKMLVKCSKNLNRPYPLNKLLQFAEKKGKQKMAALLMELGATRQGNSMLTMQFTSDSRTPNKQTRLKRGYFFEMENEPKSTTPEEAELKEPGRKRRGLDIMPLG